MIGPVVILSPSPAVFHSRIQNRFLVAEMTSKMCYRAPFLQTKNYPFGNVQIIRSTYELQRNVLQKD